LAGPVWAKVPALPGRRGGGPGNLWAGPLRGVAPYPRATARKLAALQKRRLDGYDFVAMVLDGKSFAEETMVVALG